jgi:hypothetical protein
MLLRPGTLLVVAFLLCVLSSCGAKSGADAGGMGGGGDSLDAGAIDGGALDGGALDGGDPDSGHLDAGNADAGPPDAGYDGGLIAESSFCAAYASAFCDREKGCDFLDSTHETLCLDRAKDRCAIALTRISGGLHTYDMAIAWDCLESIRAGLTCSEGRGVQATTGEVFDYPCLYSLGHAAAGLGHACYWTGDCLTGYCVGAAPTTCAACRAHVAIGGACDDFRRCDPQSSFCAWAGDGGAECKALAKVHQPCLGDFGCDPKTTGYCEDGFDDGGLEDGGQRTCQPARPDGTPCFEGYECASRHCNAIGYLGDAGPSTCGDRSLGEICAQRDDCGQDNFCKGLSLSSGGIIAGLCTPRHATGAACTVEAFENYGGCIKGQQCLGGFCRLAGTQAINQPCMNTDHCLRTLYCNRASKICLPRATTGAACDNYPELRMCTEGSECLSGVCVTPRSAGGGCTRNLDCKEFLQCDSAPNDAGICSEYPMTGSSCESGVSICASGNAPGYCEARDAGIQSDGGTVNTVCADRLGESQVCVADDQCGTERCRNPDGGVVGPGSPGACARLCW